jgi:hypothetical protein
MYDMTRPGSFALGYQQKSDGKVALAISWIVKSVIVENPKTT